MLRCALLLALAFASVAQSDDYDTVRDLWKVDRLYEALDMVEPLLEANPKDGDLHGIHGRILFDLARFDEALEAMDRATALDDSWGNLAKSYACRVAFYRGQDDEVRKLLPTFEHGATTEALPFLIDPPGMTRHQLKKGHYIVYVDQTLSFTKGEVFTAKMMELIYDAYSTVFPFEVDERMISRVYVFGETEEYQRFSMKAVGSNKSSAAGYFSPSTRALVVDADPEGVATNRSGFTPDAIDTLFHEGFHQFVRLHVPQGFPDWFNEGLAEYFGPSTAHGKKKLKVGVVLKNHPTKVTRYERIRNTLRDHPGSVWSVERFMTMSDEDFDMEGRSLLNYAQAWSLVHFFIQGMGKKGRKLVKAYFTALREGKTPEEAFKESFGELNMRKLDKAWRNYVLKQL